MSWPIVDIATNPKTLIFQVEDKSLSIDIPSPVRATVDDAFLVGRLRFDTVDMKFGEAGRLVVSMKVGI